MLLWGPTSKHDLPVANFSVSRGRTSWQADMRRGTRYGNTKAEKHEGGIWQAIITDIVDYGITPESRRVIEKRRKRLFVAIKTASI